MTTETREGIASCSHREAVFGCAGCVARIRGAMPRFPLQTSRTAPPGPLSIPWEVAEKAFSAYAARYGRGQSLERLAQRAGFSWDEMDVFLPGWRAEVDELARLLAALCDLLAIIRRSPGDLPTELLDAAHRAASATVTVHPHESGRARGDLE